MASRTLWVLPHRTQTGETEVIEQGITNKFTQTIQVAQLPKEIFIGIPESVLSIHTEDDFLFSQFHRKGYQRCDIFLISLRCGTDKEGRTVFLTLFRILVAGDDPLDFQIEQSLPLEEKSSVINLRNRIQNKDDWGIRSIKEMLKAVENHKNLNSFSNVPIPNCVYLPDWPVKKKLLRAFVIFLVIIILLVTLILSFIGNTTSPN